LNLKQLKIEHQLQQIKEKIEKACKRAKRDPKEVKLLAVSKTKPLILIDEAAKCGQLDFGENYAQDFHDKSNQRPDYHWHFIGPLQSNKIKLVLPNIALLHSIDRISLAKKCQKHCEILDRHLSCLLQINISREKQKTGILPEEFESVISEYKALDRLKIKGLMCIPEAGGSESLLRDRFSEMKSLFDQHSFTILSMGMSQDFELAIEEGSTLIRIGTSIFGKRNFKV